MFYEFSIIYTPFKKAIIFGKRELSCVHKTRKIVRDCDMCTASYLARVKYFSATVAWAAYRELMLAESKSGKSREAAAAFVSASTCTLHHLVFTLLCILSCSVCWVFAASRPIFQPRLQQSLTKY